MPTRAQTLLADHLRHPPAVAPPLPTLLIPIKPRFATLIARGVKRVDFRRRFPAHVTAARAVFYTSSPVRALTLTATITRVHRAAPGALWQAFSSIGGIARPDFDAYLAGTPSPAALLLENAQPLSPPIPIDDPTLRAINFRAPQSPTILPPESPLIKLLDARVIR